MFVIYLGLTSHWVSIVAHKQNDELKFYLMDSSNMEILNCKDREVPVIYEANLQDDISVGIPKKTKDHFTTKMVLQSMFDLRYFMLFLPSMFKEQNGLV